MNNRVVGLQVATHKLVWLTNANDLADSRHLLQASGLNRPFVAGDADRSPLSARNGMRAQSQSFDFAANVAHLLFGRVGLHDN